MIANKACPVVLRGTGAAVEILAFEHPLAGLQLVKGSIEPGESCAVAALRELWEESGIPDGKIIRELGTWDSGHEKQIWWFAQVLTPDDLPQSWCHHAHDDGGHDFRFFWHRLHAVADARWHPVFQGALAYLRRVV